MDYHTLSPRVAPGIGISQKQVFILGEILWLVPHQAMTFGLLYVPRCGPGIWILAVRSDSHPLTTPPFWPPSCAKR